MELVDTGSRFGIKALRVGHFISGFGTFKSWVVVCL